MQSKEIENWVKGFFLFGIGIFILLSLFSFNAYDRTFSFCQFGVPVLKNTANFGGIIGAYLSGLLVFLFGQSSYILVILLLILGWNSLWGERTRCWIKIVSNAGLLLVCACFFSLLPQNQPYLSGGITGLITGNTLKSFFGEKGMYLILSVCGLGFIGLGNKLYIKPISDYLEEFVLRQKDSIPEIESEYQKEPERKTRRKKTIRKTRETPERIIYTKAKPKRELPVKKTHTVSKKSSIQLPPLSLLKVGKSTTKQTQEDCDRYAQVIEETLSDFRIAGEIVKINQGPRVTMYELQLAPGIPVQKVHSISDNISMSLKTTSVRIVAPIPGKSTVGIEVPNRDISIVYLRDILACKEFQDNPSKLAIAIGIDIMGKPIVADLKTMPHLLIAGATGSGKTVCINSLIASILYKATHEDVKLLMIDPKMVELTLYNDLPHLMTPVVVETKKAIIALQWLIAEMEKRYRMFAENKVRNIESYNIKNKEEAFPYIVVIIDELADLMMLARNEIENSICRLAQLSRAAGIHLIIATQRPSVNVITGVIKANLPCRISFQVPSGFDSRTIIDTVGAEKLLGRGDLLFIPPGTSRVGRVQGCFISDEEIENICNFFKAQKEPDYNMEILRKTKENDISDEPEQQDTTDEFYETAKKIILDTRIASISMLQRRLKIGFNRSARLIEMMEQEGLVGPYREGKPREVIGSNDYEK